jgi:hypothetical protein
MQYRIKKYSQVISKVSAGYMGLIKYLLLEQYMRFPSEDYIVECYRAISALN